MRTSRQMSVPLPPEQEQDEEAWLRSPVAAAFDAVVDGSAELLTPEEVRASLAVAVGRSLDN